MPVRARPGAATLADATPLPLPELAAGDRVAIAGAWSADHGQLTARKLAVMSHLDIEGRQEKERADWRQRGLLGTVASVDTATGVIRLRTGRGMSVGQAAVVTAGRDVGYRRYAPGSRRFSEAQPSTLAQVRVGDELRVLGNRDAAGAVLAEQIVFGTFHVFTGAFVAMATDGRSVTVQDEASGKKVTVALGPDTPLRRFAFARGEAARGDDPLDRMPSATAAELKPGERILVAATQDDPAATPNGVALVAGLPAPFAGREGGRRGAAGAASPDAGLPPELLELGMGVP